jgi:predicted metal-dependent hydrolase
VTLAELFNHPDLRGVCVGACPDGKAYLRDHRAHGHLEPPGYKYRNWICVATPYDFNATTIAHELAHLLVGHEIHNDRWRRQMRALGGRVERRYQKRPRKEVR